MNTTFNFNRLGLLLKRFFIENKQRELIFWGIMICVFALVHQGDSVKMILYITGFIFAARQFKQFSYAPGGMQYLLIPATHIEKLTASILLSTVYFFIMTLLTYCIGNVIGTNLQNLIFETTNPVSWDLFYASGMHSMHYSGEANQFWATFKVFAFLQALFLLGSLYFKRNAVGKTMLSIVCLGIILTIIEICLFKLTFGTLSIRNPSITINLFGNSSNSIIPQNLKLVTDVAGYLTIPFLWLVSYFRLTEKQV